MLSEHVLGQVSSLLKEVAGVEKGANNPGKEVAATVTWKQVIILMN